MSNVRWALRDATHAVHESLHGHSAFASLLSGDIEVPSYRELLKTLYGFHEPLETALLNGRSLSPPGIDLDARRRVHRLADDLYALGLEPAALDRLPRAIPPEIATRGQLLGVLYVREGAMLGGRVLARKLDPLFGSGTSARSFFTGDDGDTKRWHQCCDALDTAGTAGILDEMIAAARAAFALFENWLTSNCAAARNRTLP